MNTSIMASVSKTLMELEKSEKYHRTSSLNLGCGSDTLRALIDKELGLKGLTLKRYLQDSTVQSKVARLKKQKILYGEQIKQLSSKKPNLHCMDFSLLTIILLELLPIPAQESNIKQLRKKRNELAHSDAKLNDDIPFNEASQIIIDMSKDVSPEFESDIKMQIKDLCRRELVYTHSNLDIVKLHNESFMVKLVESGKCQKVDHKSDIWIKYGLTKFVRTLSRYLEIEVFLQDLYREQVIDEQTKRMLDQTYNYEEQMNLLVLHIVEEEAVEKILKFCNCLQKVNSLLADLVLFRQHSEIDIETHLKEVEYENIKKILVSAFVTDVSKNIPCEDVHIFVDEKRRLFTNFDTISSCVKEQFPEVICKENDSQFHGLTWLDSTRCTNNESCVLGEIDDSLSDMPSDKFSKFLNLQMEKHRTGIGLLFETTIEDECISSSIFSNLTTDQLEELFGPPLNKANFKFGYGIRSALAELQKNIKRHALRSSFEKNDILRKFDRPFESAVYQQCIVRPATGNLLVPVHEFVLPRLKSQMSAAFIGKEVVRFAAACLNGKKNGTIHFGIKDVGNGNGEIIGLSKDAFIFGQNINLEIKHCIHSCFGQNVASIADRSVRPVQVVDVVDNKVVIEVDVVSVSSFLDKEIIGIMFPPKGHQRKKYFIHKENMITTIEESRLDAIKADLENILSERIQLERELRLMDVTHHQAGLKRQKLVKLLTGGNRFVTDAFTPVIFCGDRTGCEKEIMIQEHLQSMKTAFTSSAAVFDFGASVELQNSIEQEKYIFQVKLADDSSSKRFRHDSDLGLDRTLWVYSNGYEELGKGPMNIELWYETRLN